MKAPIPTLSLAALLVMSGCASTTTLSQSSFAVTPADPKVVTPTGEPRCPPETEGRPLERDLTVPFSQRTYLLYSGELCTPRPYRASLVGQVFEPTTAAGSAEPSRQVPFYRRGLHDGR